MSNTNTKRKQVVEEVEEEQEPSRFFAIMLSLFIVIAIMVVYSLVFH
jgi:flagellar biogenesis protein FliO